MSRRPSFDISGKNGSGNRVSCANSPLDARPATTHSPAHANMSTRKRPLDSQLRGQSPPEPDKRSRPPERPASMQERHANPDGSSAPVSPPNSRKNSMVALPANVPTRPRHRSGLPVEQVTSDRTLHNGTSRAMSDTATRNDVNVISPGNTGSGGSTPVQVAPPAPSMLPSGASHTDRLQQQEQAASKKASPAMATLRGIKLKKQDRTSSSGVVEDLSTTTLTLTKIQTQLRDQQAEITQLKKEREEMSNKFKELASLANEVRLVDAAMSQYAEEFQGDVSTLKTNVDSLKSTQTNAATKDQLKDLVLQTVIAKTEDVRKDLQAEIESVKMKLMKRFDKDHATHALFTPGILEIKDALKKSNIPSVQSLLNKVLEIEENEAKTYDRTTGIEKNLERLKEQTNADLDSLFYKIDECIGPVKREFEINGKNMIEQLTTVVSVAGQVRNFQAEQSKLSSSHRRLDTQQDELYLRVDSLENNANRAGPPVAPNDDTTNARLGQFDKDVKELRQSLEKVKDTVPKVAHLDERLASAERNSEKHKQLAEDVEALGNRVSSLEQTSVSSSSLSDVRSDMNIFQKNLDQLSEGLETAERTIHSHYDRIVTLEEDVPALFNNTFPPFKQAVEQQLEDINNKLELHSEETTTLKQLVAESQTQSLQTSYPETNQAQLNSIIEETTSMKESISLLQTSLENEAIVRDHDVKTAMGQLVTKADASATGEQMAAFKLSLRNLHDQYNNITTDDLHQRMVHWFMQMYPSNATNMVQQFASTQHDVAQLKPFTPILAWIQSRSQDLNALLDNTVQLQVLLQSSAELQRLPQTLTKIDEASANAKTAITKAEEAGSKMDQQGKQVETLQGALSGLQNSFHKLSLDSSAFAKNQTVNALEAKVDEAFAREQRERIDSTNSLRTSAGFQFDQFVKFEEQLKSSFNELTKRFEEVHDKLNQLRQHFDTVNKNDIQPNKDSFSLCGSNAKAVQQLQKVVGDLNQNNPVAPLIFTWDPDYNAILGEPESSNDTRNGLCVQVSETPILAPIPSPAPVQRSSSSDIASCLPPAVHDSAIHSGVSTLFRQSGMSKDKDKDKGKSKR